MYEFKLNLEKFVDFKINEFTIYEKKRLLKKRKLVLL